MPGLWSATGSRTVRVPERRTIVPSRNSRLPVSAATSSVSVCRCPGAIVKRAGETLTSHGSAPSYVTV